MNKFRELKNIKGYVGERDLKFYKKGQQERDRNWLGIILTKRNLAVGGMKIRDFNTEVILHSMGFNIDLIPDGEIIDSKFYEVIDNLLKKKVKE